jgi:hypothetical protein
MEKQNTPDIVVAPYGLGSEGWEYHNRLTPGTKAVEWLLDGLPEIFARTPGAPQINTKTMQQLYSKLKKTLREFAVGSLADVRIIFPVDNDPRAFGFHRMPVAADRHIPSILLITMNRFGHLSEFRLRPDADGMTTKAAAFGVEGQHVH